VAHIPDDFIIRGIKRVVQGDGQLDHAQARCQVPAGSGNGVDHFFPDFLRQLRQLFRFEQAQRRRAIDPVKKSRHRYLFFPFIQKRFRFRLIAVPL